MNGFSQFTIPLLDRLACHDKITLAPGRPNRMTDLAQALISQYVPKITPEQMTEALATAKCRKRLLRARRLQRS
eukprot:1835085-Amphidinium_carterae.1